MNREKGLVKFILTDRRFSLFDKFEYFLYRISGIIYASIFVFLIYEKLMGRVDTDLPGFLMLLISPLFLFAAWSRRIVAKFIEPYKQERGRQ